MNALVTGATGFIGSHLVDGLIKEGYRVTCLVRKTSNLRWIEGLDIGIFYGDCEDEGSLQALPADFDYVFHLAGLTKAKRDEDFFCANLKGTENLLRIISKRTGRLRRFVYLSSLAAAGPSRDGNPSTETMEPNPVSSYGRSKLEGERATWRHRDMIPVTIIRPPAVYGPRDRDFHLFFQMVKKGFYPYWGKCYYSLLYVEDLIRGLIKASVAKEAATGIYFLSDGMVYSNEDIMNEIREVLDAKVLKVRIPKAVMSLVARIGEGIGKDTSIINRDKIRELSHSYWVCDPKKAEREYGFTPKVLLKEGIKWTADWYRIHQWL